MIDSSLNNINSLLEQIGALLPQDMQSQLIGCSIYGRYPYSDYTSILANYDGPASDNKHQKFLYQFNDRALIHMPFKAIGDIFLRKRPGDFTACHSGYKPNQFCLGVWLPVDSTDLALQIIIRNDDIFTPLQDKDLSAFQQKLLNSEPYHNLCTLLSRIDFMAFRERKIGKNPIHYPAWPAIIGEYDIKKSQTIDNTVGTHEEAEDIYYTVREKIIAPAMASIGGRIASPRGDGSRIVFGASLSKAESEKYLGQIFEVASGCQAHITELLKNKGIDISKMGFRFACISTERLRLQQCSSPISSYTLASDKMRQLSNMMRDSGSGLQQYDQEARYLEASLHNL